MKDIKVNPIRQLNRYLGDLLSERQSLLRVARAAKEYRRSTTDWLMDEDDREDLVRADGNALDKALKEVEHLLD